MAAIVKSNQHAEGERRRGEGGTEGERVGQLVMHDLSLAHWAVPSPTRYG